MKVAMVTSWPPRWCGIAIYSENLVRALREAGVEVHIVCHTDGGRPGEDNVHPVIDQGDPGWYRALIRAVEEINPDVVHVQHEFGLYTHFHTPGVYDFEPRNAFELAMPLFRWRATRRPAVVTYHSVFSRLTQEEALYYDHTMGLAAANIVHEPYQRDLLPVNLGRVPDNVFAIPHGAGRGRPDRRTRAQARRRLGLPEGRPVLGMMGWWEPNKGFDRVIRLWPEVVRQVPEAILVLAGEARPGSPTGAATRAEYLDLVDRSPARDSIRVVRGCFSREEYMEVLAACDALALPYRYASQSGNLAHAYEAGLPVVVSGIEGLKSSVEHSGAGLVVPGAEGEGPDRELREALVRILRDGALRRRLAARAAAYVRSTVAWDRVARRHLEVYRWAMARVNDRRTRSRFLPHRVHV